MPRARVFLIGDTSNRWNWGCRATSFQLRALLNSVGEIVYAFDTSSPRARLGPRVDPALRKWSTAVGKQRTGIQKAVRDFAAPLAYRYDPGLIARNSSLLGHMGPEDLPRIAKLIRERKIFPEVARAIEESDVTIVNGEGSLLEDRAVGRLKLLLAYTAKTEFGKPAAIVNHTADVRAPGLAAIAEHVYPVLDDAQFRERFSFELASPLRQGARAGLAADCAFQFEPLDAAQYAAIAGRTDYASIYPEDGTGFDASQPYVCVGGSAAYLNRTKDYAALRQVYRTMCEGLAKLGSVVVTASSTPDDIILRPVAREMGLPFFGLATPVQQAVDLLGNARCYVGGRWHPGILALTGGTPVVAVSSNSDFKSRGLTDLVGLEQPSISAFEVQAHTAALVDLATQYVTAGEALRTDLTAKVAALRESSLENVRLVRELSAAQ